MIYGYILDAQEKLEERQRAMSNSGMEWQNIYADVRLSKTFMTTKSNRPAYLELLRVLQPGDVVYIKEFDDLGYSYEDILEQWVVLTQEQRVEVAVLDMPLVDTRWRKEIVGTYVTDLLISIFGYLAKKRKVIKQHQSEAMAKAKEKGVRIGAPPKPLPFNFPLVYKDYMEGKISLREGARRCRMSHNTFRRKVMEYKEV